MHPDGNARPNCWICGTQPADSAEHLFLKCVYEKLLGKPQANESRFISYFGGAQNIPVKSFKNKRFRFGKSICRRCNDTLTQPYDDACREFVDWLFSSKTTIVNRNRLVVPKRINSAHLALYFVKIFGCLLADLKGEVRKVDFQRMRSALQTQLPTPARLYLSFHRDLAKLGAKRQTILSQLPQVTNDFTLWTFDLDWISLILGYPFPPPAEKYGTPWDLGAAFGPMTIGKLK